MSATGKRGADKLHIVGVVVVGICGAVLTYVSIILLEAFYMADTSAADRDAAHEKPGSLRETVKAAQLVNIGEYRNGTTPDKKFVPIERAMELVIADAKTDPSLLVPGVGPSRTPDMMPQYGRAPALGSAPTGMPDHGAPPADGTAPVDGMTPPTTPTTAPATEMMTHPPASQPPASITPPASTTPAPAPAGGNVP